MTPISGAEDACAHGAEAEIALTQPDIMQDGVLKGLKRNHYQVILADVPWDFKYHSEKGHGKSSHRHYKAMTLDDVCNIPMSEIAAPDCALFLWCTWPTIFRAERVITSWGFRYSGLAWEWIKRNPKTGKYAFGAGFGSRKNLEPCLLARRGKPKLLNRSVRDFMFAGRREHSRKPDDQYERIESMFAGPRAEIFARQQWPGWDVAGNEVGKFTRQESLMLAAE